MKEDLIKVLKKEIKQKIDLDKLLEKPKNESQGDLALPVFILAKEMKMNPVELAKELELELKDKLPSSVSSISAAGPFLNFFANNSALAQETINNIQSGKAFKVKTKNKQKILIEYPSPNTNKALHIGHVRNILLGNSLGNILQEVGHTVIRNNLNNDRGIAICKAMLGYEMFFSKDTPESLGLKSDQFVEGCYVKFEAEMQKNPELEKKAQQMLVDWEKGDKKTRDLWKKLLNWVYDGYAFTYHNLKLPKFDKVYFESEIFDKGKEIVEKALKEKAEGFGREDDGAVFCDFKNETYGKKYLLRGDGTTVYITQDLYLASQKKKDFKADKYIFVVGKEQEYHFEVLFQLIDRLNIAEKENNYHFAYGYVYNSDGRKFSSRKGNVLRADGLLELVEDKARDNLKSKELTKNLDQKEMDRRSKIIGFGALAFSILNTNPRSDMKFDVDRALAFEGETGPYIQYTYARIQSILRKEKAPKKIDYNEFKEKEISLIKQLGEYENIILEAADKYKPSLIGNYLVKLCQAYNEFYQNSPILKADKKTKEARLLLSDSVAKTIKKSLEMFDIETLDEM